MTECGLADTAATSVGHMSKIGEPYLDERRHESSPVPIRTGGWECVYFHPANFASFPDDRLVLILERSLDEPAIGTTGVQHQLSPLLVVSKFAATLLPNSTRFGR